MFGMDSMRATVKFGMRKRGLSQIALAKKVGCSRTSVNKWLMGHTEAMDGPHWPALVSLAEEWAAEDGPQADPEALRLPLDVKCSSCHRPTAGAMLFCGWCGAGLQHRRDPENITALVMKKGS